MTSQRIDWHERDGAEVCAWRRRWLESSGVPAGLAQEVAATGGYDLHALLELIDRGCPPVLAARIVAPLDTPSGGRP